MLRIVSKVGFCNKAVPGSRNPPVGFTHKADPYRFNPLVGFTRKAGPYGFNPLNIEIEYRYTPTEPSKLAEIEIVVACLKDEVSSMKETNDQSRASLLNTVAELQKKVKCARMELQSFVGFAKGWSEHFN